MRQTIRNKIHNLRDALGRRIARSSVRHYFQRTMHIAMSGVLLVAALSVIHPGTANAYAPLSNRSILLSSTANGATNVAYQVGFTLATNNQTIGSVVVEVCGNSPILGDSCTVPTGFNSNYATLSLNSVTGNITGLSIDTTNSTSNRIVLKRTAGTVANSAVTFTLGNGTTNGLTNPANNNLTFYARIMTFTNTTGNDGGNETANATDAGGIAMSTANQLNVTAKVQETLTFCVYTGINCAAGGTAVTLGDANGVLASTTTTYSSTAFYDVASNAFSGVSVRIKGDTLKSGSFSIDPQGSTCTNDSTTSSVEQFGIRMSALGAGQTATAPYDCVPGKHSFDITNVNTVYGQEIGRTSGATDVSASTIELAAKSAGTTEAGVYTTTLTLIATATY